MIYQREEATWGILQVFQAIPGETDRYAVIIESRSHNRLEDALRNVAFYLAPKGWGLLIVHAAGLCFPILAIIFLIDDVRVDWSTENREFVKQITDQWATVKTVELPELGSR